MSQPPCSSRRGAAAVLALLVLLNCAHGRSLQQRTVFRIAGWGRRSSRVQWKAQQRWYASDASWNSYMRVTYSASSGWSSGDGGSDSEDGGGADRLGRAGSSGGQWQTDGDSSSSSSSTTRVRARARARATSRRGRWRVERSSPSSSPPPSPGAAPFVTITTAAAADAAAPAPAATGAIPTIPIPSTPAPSTSSSTPPTDPTFIDLTPLIPLYSASPPPFNVTDPLVLTPDQAASSTFEEHPEERQCKGYVNADASAADSGNTQLSMEYRGGPVLDTMAVHLVFLGRSWLSGSAAANTTMAASVFFTSNLNSMDWWEINRYYPEGPNPFRTPQCAVQLVETKVHAVPDTAVLTEVDLVQQVKSYIVNDVLDFYPRRSAYVFMLPDLQGQQFTKLNGLTSCTNFCAFHNYVTATIPGLPGRQRIPYAVVSNPLSCGSDLGFCAQQDIAANPAAAPNGFVADSMISFLAHELAEICTDPFFTSWYDDAGLENADKCVRDFGDVQTTPGGKLYNMYVEGKPFLVQSNWHLPTQRCQLAP